jgi:hypothetical protein
MSSTDRQNRLLVTEDWKRIYQSFRNAEFKSYDFDNLRRTMINYLRENYPEDFNDYIESSEYLALIDMIAFLGQNLSFRIDLNARENFLELAERRESILRLARLLSYNAKRNLAANGLLKVESIKTTEDVIDANGTNISRQSILWNDNTNPDWYEQFTKILNAALPVTNKFGRPIQSGTVNNIPTQQYKVNGAATDLPIYRFSKVIDGKNVPFEVVSAELVGPEIYEEPPLPGNNLGFFYRDDNRGFGSSNSGFFMHFRQGLLEDGTFTIDTPSTNQAVSIDSPNINNTDVWLYSLNSAGFETDLWNKVDSAKGDNAIYNSLSASQKNIYSVLTRLDDTIDLMFSDGIFGNLPQGTFKTYFRTSINSSLNITPSAMQKIAVDVNYLSAQGIEETLTFELSLKYTVLNSAASETNANIKLNAPAVYYTQDRMVTAEDYNIVPMATSQEIIKTKSVNRVSSGISRYFDLVDATGKYSKTNIYGNDGVLYKEYFNDVQGMSFTTRNDIENLIVNTIEPMLAKKHLRNFYYDKFTRVDFTFNNYKWIQDSSATNESTGRFVDGNLNNLALKTGSFTSTQLKYLTVGSLVKFVAPDGFHFMKTNNNALMTNTAQKHIGETDYIWTKVIGITGDGSEEGNILFSDNIPSLDVANPTIAEIIPALTTAISSDVKSQMIDRMFTYKTFALRYDYFAERWKIITEDNINFINDFGLGRTGDVSNQNLDASWLLLFETNGETYTVTTRSMRYIFESDEEVRFFFDGRDKIYNNKTGKTIIDTIRVLNINTILDTQSTSPFTVDFDWEISESYRDSEGYISSKKVEVSFFDNDDDGVVDDPDIFEQIVLPGINADEKIIMLEKYSPSSEVEDYRYTNGSNVYKVSSLDIVISAYEDGDVFYNTNTTAFYKIVNGVLEPTNDYKSFVGRADIKFQYIHNADENYRIDPSSTNIIDTYLLLKSYDIEYRNWLKGNTNSEPLPLSSDQMFLNFGQEINAKKSISDEVIYHPVKYKALFGSKAKTEMQAKFKIVKNEDIVITDNQLKADVITYVNQFFALENWDFGDTFYFQEMAAYVIQKMAPNLKTLVLVPTSVDQVFGSLFEIKSEDDEIFVSAATVDDVEVISAITASRLKASGNVVTSDTSSTVGIQSSAANFDSVSANGSY